MKHCRDCADNNGTCPHDNKPCDPKERAAMTTKDNQLQDELAWLVEAKRNNNIVYLNLFGWISSADQALRFSREDDALSVIKQLSYLMPEQIKQVTGVKAAEHMWIAAAPNSGG